jgi:hypothetical protein
LILAMDGVPAEVKTQVLLDKYHATQDISDYISYLNSIPSSKTTTVYTQYVASGDSSIAGHSRGSDTPTPRRLGGMIPAAVLGRYIGGPYTLINEDQPEMLIGGQGAIVLPGSATRAKRQAMDSGGDMHFHAPITVIANDPAQFGRQMRSRDVTGSRR